ncbi:MAG: hypothetical protein K8T20_01385 [Planctomycetes bacterium]|nr:hypothetical protein [Planctomycetota bacterium]
MNRMASWLALAVALTALVVAVMALKRQSATPSAESVAATPGVPASPVKTLSDPALSSLPAPGLSASDSATIAAEAIAKREREMVDRLWPRVARLRARGGRSAPAKPSKLDDLLAILLDEDGDEDEGGEPPESVKQTTHCKNDLKQLGIYFAIFESKYHYYPASFDDLKSPDLLAPSSLGILQCPFDKSGDACSYEYLHPIRGDNEAPDAIMAYDKHLHPDGRRCVLYFQGRVDSVVDADFQKMLGEQTVADRADMAELVIKARSEALQDDLPEKDKAAAMKRLSILEGIRR